MFALGFVSLHLVALIVAHAVNHWFAWIVLDYSAGIFFIAA